MKQFYSLQKILEIANGDKSFVREMILVFIDQCKEVNALFKTALNNKKIKELGENAHKLKSSTEIMELTTVKEEIQKIVDIARSGERNEEIFKLSKYVTDQLDVVIVQLAGELSNWPEEVH